MKTSEIRWDSSEVLLEWIRQLPDDRTFTVVEAARTLGLVETTVREKIRIWTDVVERAGGSGGRGSPFQFRRICPQVPASTETLAREADVEVAPSEPASHSTLWQSSPAALVLALLRRDPSVEWTADGLKEEAGLPNEVVFSVLNGLMRTQTVVSYLHDDNVRRYAIAVAPAAQPPTEPSLPTLLPLPGSLGFDERAAFDVLRREPLGLPARMVGARLNWSNTRTERVVASLIQRRHVKAEGNRLQVLPPSA